ncbi:septal ring lytic transglycosylase RlpA family protein [candidate division KSB1 bacterium]|nr:septal ring lytic transglycosylase RlpA family protein [candidate division KSB1 bacterium]
MLNCFPQPRYRNTGYRDRPRRTNDTQNNRAHFEIESGLASYMAQELQGRTTASGEKFNMWALTAAHKTLPFGTIVRVINLENNKSVDVRINDRGPFKRGRIIDLSYEAARILDFINNGLTKVEIRVIKPVP